MFQNMLDGRVQGMMFFVRALMKNGPLRDGLTPEAAAETVGTYQWGGLYSVECESQLGGGKTQALAGRGADAASPVLARPRDGYARAFCGECGRIVSCGHRMISVGNNDERL